MTSLREHLLQLDITRVEQATRHPFLIRAATSSLPTQQLKVWLGQDRLYALSYVQFISGILDKIALPTTSTLSDSVQGRYVTLLIDCLINIRREINLFEETARTEGWLDEICSARPSIATRAYQDLFAGSIAPHRPLLTAVVTLWATEWCYYTSWSYAAAHIPQSQQGQKQDVMQKIFIPNWSSEDFKSFVEELGTFVDLFSRDEERGGTAWREAEDTFRQVLWAETNFWPDVI